LKNTLIFNLSAAYCVYLLLLFKLKRAKNMSEFNEHAGYNCPESLPKTPNNLPSKVETIRAGATYGLPVYKV
jgi:hypothetical protein